MAEQSGNPATPTTSAAAAAASRVDRSPRYAAISPTEALQYAKKIWVEDKRNLVSSDMACQHMGYKAKNGTSQTVLASLKQYGLLISVGKDVRITDDADTIFLAPEDLPERHALIRKIAMRPELFNKVLDRFPDGLPSDANLRFRLMKDFEFANDKAADNFIASLRDAIAVRDRCDVALKGKGADTGAEVISTESVQMPPEVANPPTARPTISAPPIHGAAPTLPAHARSWDLGGGSIVGLSLPPRLSKKNIEKFKKYLTALEMEASITWDDDGFIEL
jgi:hypothetical protein